MSEYYFHKCSIDKGELNNQIKDFNPSGTEYQLKKYYKPAYNRYCGHECTVTGREYKKYGVKTLDIAKRIMDYGMHPPTIYFPHFEPYAEETIMVEPPESESKETLDKFMIL